MNTMLRDQILRGALESVRDSIDPGKKDHVSARRAREIAVKALFATREPDPLLRLAGELLTLVDQMQRELEVSEKAASAGEIWSCVHVPGLIKAATETIRKARAAGIKIETSSSGGGMLVTPTGPL